MCFKVVFITCLVYSNVACRALLFHKFNQSNICSILILDLIKEVYSLPRYSDLDLAYFIIIQDIRDEKNDWTLNDLSVSMFWCNIHQKEFSNQQFSV